ncbi:hypothetical protein KIW84_022993, partial [Lathyrus oleraceus]
RGDVGGTTVEGEEQRQYYKCRARVPLKFYEVKESGKETVMGDNSGEFVYVSDDDGDWEKAWGNVDGGVRNDDLEKVVQEIQMQGNEKRKMRIKTVAKKSVSNRRIRCADPDDAKDCELEFTQGDGDVFVGVRFNS